MKHIIWLLILPIFISCESEPKELSLGNWRATLEVQDQKLLPFNFVYNADKSITIINAEERIKVTDIEINGDSITISHPVFEGVFKGVWSDNTITGDFIKPSLERVVPFEMIFGDADRFITKQQATFDISGNWETVFSGDSEEDRYIAKGIFKQSGNHVSGTFRTTTGDYRYLEGVVDGKTLKLSTFDGAHAFLFEAEISDSTLQGFFYSGNHWKEPFKAKRNEDYELPNANELTFLKEGYDKFAFSFPDSEGNIISLDDERFQNKVVVVQIMGTWCPNCLEETRYYADYLKKNPSQELEFVSLAFEYATTEERAFRGINKLKESVGIDYPVLLAQYGSSSKAEANEKLPMLNHVLSYPTTVFIDKQGAVRKIHTGFNGKATGAPYDEFVADFESFIAQLLKE